MKLKKLNDALDFISESKRVKNEIESCINLLLQKDFILIDYSPRILSTKHTFMYSLPNAAYNTILAIIVNFTLIYYVNMMGQPPIIIGSIFSIALYVYAFMCIFWGTISDKIGKRKVLWIGGPLLSVTSVLLWMPPISNLKSGMPYLPLILWFIFFSISFRVAGAAFQTSIYSLLPELSKDERNRVKISMINMIMMTIGTLIGVMGIILMMGEATKNLERNDPQLYYHESSIVQAIYFRIILFSTIISIVFLIFFVLMQAVLKKHLQKSENFQFQQKITRNLMTPFKDKNYRSWLISYFLSWIPFIAFQFLILNIATFVLKLRGDEFVILALSVLPAVIISFIIWQRLSIKFGLKKTYSICLLFGSATFFLISILIIPMSHEIKIMIGIILVFLIVCSLVGVIGLPLVVISKFIDNAEQKNENSLSGSYSGAYMMIGSLSAATAMLFISVFLQIFGNENPVSYAIIFTIGAILILIAIIIFQKVQFVIKEG